MDLQPVCLLRARAAGSESAAASTAPPGGEEELSATLLCVFLVDLL